MSRTSVNFLLDAVLLLMFVVLATVTAVLRIAFPAPTAADGWTLWGHGLDVWTTVQCVVLAVLALGILVHIMLHWGWVCGVVATRWARWRGRSYRKAPALHTLYGVTLLIGVLTIAAVAIIAASLSVVSPR